MESVESAHSNLLSMTSDTPLVADLKAAYRSLAEELKRALLKEVAAEQPKFLGDWITAAGLGKGYRQQTVTERKNAHCREKMDEALVREGSEEMLMFAARRFFIVVRPEFVRRLNELGMEGRTNGDSDLADELLEALKPEMGGATGWSFFDAAMRLTPDTFIFPKELCAEPEDDRAEIAEPPLERTGTEWDVDLAGLDASCAELSAGIAQLRAAKAVDLPALQAALDDAFLTASVLRDELETSATESDFPGEPWQNAAGLRDYAAALAVHLHARSGAAQRRELLAALAARLETARVSHRVPRQQLRLDALRTRAVVELQALIDAGAPPELPGPVAADAWLRWALERAGSEIEELRERLTAQGLAALADFIEGCEAGELGLSVAPRVEPERSSVTPATPGGRFVEPAPAAEKNPAAEPPAAADRSRTRTEPPPVDKPAEAEVATGPGGNTVEAPVSDQLGGADGAIAHTKESPGGPPRTLVPEKIAIFQTPRATPPRAKIEPAGPSSAQSPAADLFSAAVDLQTLARAATLSPGEAAGTAFSALTWRLIHEGRRGLAFQMANDVEQRWPGAERTLPAAAVRATALALRVQSESGELYRCLQKDFRDATEALMPGESSAANLSSRLLLGAAALRPALLAPRSGAATVLREMHLGAALSHFNDLAKPIWEFGDRGVPLNPEALEGVQSKAAWEEKLSALRDEAEGWWNSAENAAIITRPGAHTWRRMMESDGVIGRLLAGVRENSAEPGRLKKLRELIEEFDNDAAFDAEARRTYSQVLTHRGQLVQPAAKKIIRLGREAVQVARRWASLQEVRPDGALGFLLKHASDLRRELDRRYDKVIGELREFADGSEDVTVAAAVHYAIEAVENICALFSGGSQPVEPPVRFVLHAGLLRFPEIQLNADWEPIEAAEPVALTLARALAAGTVPSWPEAFERQADKRDHEATGHIIEFLEWQNDPSVDALRTTQEQQVELCRDALRRETHETRARLDRAMRQGLITHADFNETNAKVTALDGAIDTTLNFHRQTAALKQMRSIIDQREVLQREAVRQRLDRLPASLSAEVVQAIRTALDSGDIVTANDYIERAERGAALHEPASRRPQFLEFFGGAAGEDRGRFFTLIEELEPSVNAPARIVSAAHNRTPVLGIEFKRMPAEQADKTARAIEAWFDAKRQRQLSGDQCRAILAGLGFTVSKAENRRKAEHTWLEITTEPTDQSPVAAFGSEAGGHFRVFSAFSESMETLCKLASPQDFQRHGTFVFYFDALDERRRRELARLCRESAGAFAVIDTVLLLHVCAAIGTRARLPRLFDCALPFSRVQPYITTAGRMPPEMFFGRHREIEELTSLMGSCFVYGGRQLGKTALLRHVEERFHAPRAGRLACWLDLKHHGLHSIDDIWPVLAGHLGKFGVLGESASRQITLETLLEHARTWLEADEERRILLLLDEADNFLKADATDPASKVPFSRCVRLRGLMDATQKRFKVVFAGLHNVQRTTRVANHPLAHYGQPLCIGPLLNDPRDAEEARRLVEEPLAAAGYFFESSYPVVHILAQSNYYPSLIQLYCQRLLRHATDSVRQFDIRTTPPYLLTLRHVEDAYNSLELQSAIAEKFRLTLDLDPKYRLIAIILAFYKEEAERGFEIARLRNEATTWWEKGFSKTSDEDFAELLEEMVGLGVLRRSTSRALYFLRNPNLVPLLGRPEEIEKELENFSGKEPEPEFDPVHFRRPLRAGDHGVRSPLSVAHESELRSLQKDAVFVFAGTPAAEISKLRDAVEAIIDRDRLSLMSNLRAVQTFSEKLREISARAAAGVNIAFVPAEAAWDEQWLRAAIERTQKRGAEQSRLGVVFVASPELAWQQTDALRALDAGGQISLRTLRPWNEAALRQWLEECQFGPRDSDGRRELLEVTGNWPLLLGQAYRASREHDWKASVDELRKSGSTELLPALGCEDPARRQVLEVWAQLGDVATARDLAALCSFASEGFVEKVFHWTQIIGLATRAADSWHLDPLLARVLNAPGG